MQLDKNKFALAATAVMGAWYVICAALVATIPQVALKLFSWLVHLVNLEPAVLTWGSFFAGLVEILILSYLTALVFAWLHNRFLKPAA